MDQSSPVSSVSLKIDVDTYEGMRDGVPRLLDSLARFDVKATFCLSFGPDNSGKAIFKLFKDPQFLKKMLKTGAPKLYGWRTVLSGTLLPARPIAISFPDIVRQIKSQGHEVIVHAWNHRLWQDRLPKMYSDEIMYEFKRAFKAYQAILGTKPHAVAAPGWQATPLSLRVQDQLDLLYASDIREGPPCYLEANGENYKTLQIPTTGPCIEELLTLGYRSDEEIMSKILEGIKNTDHPVVAIHAEVEGGIYNQLFQQKMLPTLIKKFKKVMTLQERYEQLTTSPLTIPRRRLCWIELPGRAGKIASSQSMPSN